MASRENPYAAPQELTGAECLLVDGAVNYGKDKGPGQLLLTRTALFALRSNNQNAMTGAAVGGLLGALIGHMIDRHRSKQRPPSVHLEDPEIQALNDSVRKKVERSSLVVKLPLSNAVHIERTFFGYKFNPSAATPLVFSGWLHKKKVAAFLEKIGLTVV